VLTINANSDARERPMDFKAATDCLTDRITANDIAKPFGLVASTIAHARLDPSSSAYRTPPENWQPMVACLALKRCAELMALVNELRHHS